MTDNLPHSAFNTLVIVWTVSALLILPLLIKVRAPYGRHTTKKWGRLIDNKTGWLLMELPSMVLFAILFLTGDNKPSIVSYLIFSAWMVHYTNRIFIFPFRTHTSGKKMPVLIVLLAAIFNLINGFLNGFWLGHIALIDNNWLTDPRCIAGMGLFIIGFAINQTADNHLIHLRKKGDSGYYIPTSKLFQRISCPNFAGELIEWCGYAVMTWSLPGLSFALWTAVNLIPRAVHHHSWYKENFPDYPPERKAIIPGIL